MVRRASTEKFDRIEHLRDRITLHQGDLLDQRSLVDTLRAARPDEVYNLAAMSFVAVSWIQPTLTAEFTGVGVTRHARGACARSARRRASTRRARARCSARCSRRRRPRRRRSTRARPYGVAKCYGHFITVNYRESYDMHLSLGDPLQPRVAAPRARVRDAQDHLARRGDQARPARRAAARQPRRQARLGLREGLRRGDVADAPAGHARGLRDRHGRDEHRAPLRRDRVRPGRRWSGSRT